MSDDPRQDPDGTSRHLAAIACEAGRLLAAVAERATGHRLKEDGSPSTQADLLSERLVLGRLGEIWPGIRVVAEESASMEATGGLFFLVDPLDGTRDYVSGAGEYSVNIALISGDRPVAAAIAAPAANRVWAAGLSAETSPLPGHDGSFRWRRVSARPASPDGLVALVSRRHGDAATEACLATLPIGSRRVASSAYKFCLVASGEADVYVRCGPTMEWDTAAGDHILTRAGGVVIGPAGPLVYGRRERGYLNGPFAALGDRALAGRITLPAACS